MTHTCENITFPQLLWWAVITLACKTCIPNASHNVILLCMSPFNLKACARLLYPDALVGATCTARLKNSRAAMMSPLSAACTPSFSNLLDSITASVSSSTENMKLEISIKYVTLFLTKWIRQNEFLYYRVYQSKPISCVFNACEVEI